MTRYTPSENAVEDKGFSPMAASRLSPSSYEGEDARRISLVRTVKFSRLSLRFKATLFIILLILAVTSAVSGFLLQRFAQSVRLHEEEGALQMGALLAKVVEPAMKQPSESLLKEIVDQSVKLPLLYIQLFDASGTQLVLVEGAYPGFVERSGNYEARWSMLGMPRFIPGDDRYPGAFDVAYPVTRRWDDATDRPAQRSELLGYVRIGFSVDNWRATLTTMADMLWGVMILAVVLSIPLSVVLIHWMVAPLESLSEAMNRFMHGNLSVRSPVTRTDEIGKLCLSFNQMADQHQNNHERMVRFNAELEDRVAKRTQQLRELASRDSLTGLFNRRHFHEMLEQRRSEAVRYNTDLACVMMDIDDFKEVNDRFGHHTGDQILVLVASTIEEELRSADVAARYGGDEFIILLPQTDADQAGILCQRILDQFASTLARSFPKLGLGMSMGIASLTSIHATSSEALIRAADRALYRAKEDGKNRVVQALESEAAAPSP